MKGREGFPDSGKLAECISGQADCMPVPRCVFQCDCVLVVLVVLPVVVDGAFAGAGFAGLGLAVLAVVAGCFSDALVIARDGGCVVAGFAAAIGVVR